MDRERVYFFISNIVFFLQKTSCRKFKEKEYWLTAAILWYQTIEIGRDRGAHERNLLCCCDSLQRSWFRYSCRIGYYTQTSHNIDCALGPLCYIRACSIWITWQRSSPMKGELRLRGANSISKFHHHNINGGTVDDTWRHR
jgi:hypothetical protein